MTEPVIMPVKPGTLLKEDKATLREVGVIVIECHNPDDIRLIRPCAEVSGSDLFKVAIKALNACPDPGAAKQREAFTQALYNVVVREDEEVASA